MAKKTPLKVPAHGLALAARDILRFLAARPRDLLDVEGVVRLRWRELDLRRVRSLTRQFAELIESPNLLKPFEDALRKVRRGSALP